MKSSRASGRSTRESWIAPLRDDRHAEQGHLLVGDRRALATFPTRFAEAALRERTRELLGPRGVDRRVRAGEQPAGLDELGAHQCRRRLLRERRAREHDEAGVASADELGLWAAALALALAGGSRAASTARRLRVVAKSDLREQPGEQRAMDPVGVRLARLLRNVQAERLREPHELAVEVLPLAHAQVVQVLGAAHAAERAARELALPGLEVVPEVQQRQEVAGRVDEAGVEPVGLLALLERALARVLDREPRDDREHLARDALRLRLEHHARRIAARSAAATTDGRPA